MPTLPPPDIKCNSSDMCAGRALTLSSGAPSRAQQRLISKRVLANSEH